MEHLIESRFKTLVNFSSKMHFPCGSFALRIHIGTSWTKEELKGIIETMFAKLVHGLDIHHLHGKHEIIFNLWNHILKLTWFWFLEHFHQRWNTIWNNFLSQTFHISCHITHLPIFSPRKMLRNLHKHYQIW